MIDHVVPTVVNAYNGLHRRTFMERELLSISEVSEMMGLSAGTVRRLSEAGQLPAPIKLRNNVRWLRTDLMAWIASRRQQADVENMPSPSKRVESGPSRSHKVYGVPSIGRP